MNKGLRIVVVGVFVSGFIAALPYVENAADAGASQSTNSLIPSQGQYTPVVPTDIFDTRSGTGGAPSSIAPGQTISGINVAGFTPLGSTDPTNPIVPVLGVDSAFINIQVLSATTNGFITDYQDGQANPGNSSVSFQAGQMASGSDIVKLSSGGTTNGGSFAFTNNGTSTITIAIQVEGYFSDGTLTAPGDTYIGGNWTNIADTRNGLGGVPVGQIGPFGNLPLNVLSLAVAAGAIPSGDIGQVDALQVDVGAINPTGNGYLSFVGGNDVCNGAGYLMSPLRQMSYVSGEKVG